MADVSRCTVKLPLLIGTIVVHAIRSRYHKAHQCCLLPQQCHCLTAGKIHNRKKLSVHVLSDEHSEQNVLSLLKGILPAARE